MAPVREPVMFHAFRCRNFSNTAPTDCGVRLLPITLKVLIRLYFGERPHEFVNSIAAQHKKARAK
jgi:hypothetical protein